jgi:DNA polymerase-1
VSDCWFHTGENAVEYGAMFANGAGTAHLATDIETPGLDRNFEIRCVTMAWVDRGVTHTILLDAQRDETHGELCRDMYSRAGMIILHNGMFDMPALYHHKLIDARGMNKVVDTVVLARFGFPADVRSGGIGKGLGELSKRLMGWEDNSDGMKVAFKAAGYKTIQAGFEGMDIDSPIYRQGAMLDTVATLRLQPILREHCWEYSQNHPFERLGATSLGEAEALLETQEIVNRVALRRTAKGIRIDADYLNVYGERMNLERIMAEAELATVGLEGGVGKGAALVRYLDEQGMLPPMWPRTAKGALSSAKDHLETLDHPLAKAQRKIAEIEKVTGYIEKVESQGRITGRCHPQCGVLGASATGRMAYNSPPLQQFNADARAVLIDDGQGFTSIDWSQIEPITMGILAQDDMFLAPYEAGEDLYEPLMRAAGCNRPEAKVALLADMYGSGEASMAVRLNMGLEQAQQVRRQIRSAMPRCTRWMAKVQSLAGEYGKIVTAGGRILPVDSGGVFRAVNYIVQGSAYDVLAHTIVQMERDGLGDEFYLGMHDELVVSTTVAEEVQRIMETPPPYFEYYLGRTPVLRTDRADMGAAWAKV